MSAIDDDVLTIKQVAKEIDKKRNWVYQNKTDLGVVPKSVALLFFEVRFGGGI